MFWHFLFLSSESQSHVRVSKYLTGTWNVRNLKYSPNLKIPAETLLNFTFSRTSHENLLELHSTNESFGDYKLNFSSKAFFSLYDQTNTEKIADFEFFTTLFPHITSTGKFRDDWIFTTDFISQNSIRFQIFNEKTKEISLFYLSKPHHKKTIVEKNSLFLVSITFIALNRLIRVFQKKLYIKEAQKQAAEKQKLENPDSNHLLDKKVHDHDD